MVAGENLGRHFPWVFAYQLTAISLIWRYFQWLWRLDCMGHHRTPA